MAGANAVYAQLDRKWKSACTAILGEEVGDLSSFARYLSLGIEGMERTASAISGREVFAPAFNFQKGAPYIRADELEEFGRKIASLPQVSVNSIKDFDSLLSSVRERAFYCGNIVLGNSGRVSSSTRCTNVWFADNCADLYDSKFAAYCTDLRYVESVFGCSVGSESSFLIHCMEIFRLQRCFETLRTYTSSDCYYCASCEGCQNCLFSFNLKNKRNCIGNLELPKDEFSSLKAKLLTEIAESMQGKKSVPTIIDIINGG